MTEIWLDRGVFWLRNVAQEVTPCDAVSYRLYVSLLPAPSPASRCPIPSVISLSAAVQCRLKVQNLNNDQVVWIAKLYFPQSLHIIITEPRENTLLLNVQVWRNVGDLYGGTV
jgi:hypothetical protein